MTRACELGTLSQVQGTEWMVLLHPSLHLLRGAGGSVAAAAATTHAAFQAHAVEIATTPSSTLTSTLLCGELFAETTLPSNVCRRMNQLLFECEDKDADRCLERVLHALASPDNVRELLRLMRHEGTSVDSRMVKSWTHAVAPYTNLVRLHLLDRRLRGVLHKRAIHVIRAAVRAWQQRWPRSFEEQVTRLLPFLLEYADRGRGDFAFVRYKVSAMCTHTSSTILPTLGQAVGTCDSNARVRHSLDSWRRACATCRETMNQFMAVVDPLLESGLEGDALLSRISRLAKNASRWLRSLDMVCFLSTALIMAGRGSDLPSSELQELVSKRLAVRERVLQLAARQVLMPPVRPKVVLLETYTKPRGPCIKIRRSVPQFVHAQFQTYDKFESTQWQLHLVAGLTMLFWDLQ